MINPDFDKALYDALADSAPCLLYELEHAVLNDADTKQSNYRQTTCRICFAKRN
jgi:hypothetical protein